MSTARRVSSESGAAAERRSQPGVVGVATGESARRAVRWSLICHYDDTATLFTVYPSNRVKLTPKRDFLWGPMPFRNGFEWRINQITFLLRGLGSPCRDRLD